jgi:uncharacterized RDD family membrane protein YckC
VRLDDRITISTPEGVDVEITLAGLGSRAIAGLIDLTIEVCLLLGLLLVFGVLGGDSSGFTVAVVVVGMFVVLFGYFVGFEVLNRGRTPGKSAVGLRVLRTDGGPVGFVPSAVRNLLRLIDGWDLLTLILCPIGVVSVMVTGDNQRLGDLAAGTIVARERFEGPRRRIPAPFATAAASSSGPAWDVHAITAEEIVIVRRFLERRATLEIHARIHLADELAARLRPKVAGADGSWPSEPFLEALAALKADRA